MQVAGKYGNLRENAGNCGKKWENKGKKGKLVCCKLWKEVSVGVRVY